MSVMAEEVKTVNVLKKYKKLVLIQVENEKLCGFPYYRIHLFHNEELGKEVGNLYFAKSREAYMLTTKLSTVFTKPQLYKDIARLTEDFKL